MAQSGGAIFSNLPLIFAIGVALGLANNDGVAALAAVVGYAVLQAALGVFAIVLGIETKGSWASSLSRLVSSVAF